MAPFLLVVSLVASGLPAALEDVEPWFNSLTDQEIWESLESADPNHPSSIRLLDLTLARFRSREQLYLFRKWTDRFANLHPGTALSLHALAWRVWMTPEHLRDNGDKSQLGERLKLEDHREVWEETLQSFPDDVSGVFAARLLVSSSEAIPMSLNRIRSASPESGVAAFLSLAEGDEFAKRMDWERAVDAWLEGIERYPIDWETEEWVGRIRVSLLSAGHGVQARTVQDGAKENLQSLRRCRAALTMALNGNEEAAREEWISLIDDPKSSGELKNLCHAYLIQHRESDKTVSSSLETLRGLANAPDADVEIHLSKLNLSPPSRTLAEDLLSIANHRSDQGDIRGAIAIWKYMVKRFPVESEIATKSYRQLIDVYWRRLEAIRGIRSAFPNEEIDTFFAPVEASQEEMSRRELDKVLNESETFAASTTYSEPLFNLMTTLYEVHSGLGRPERPRNLFLLHAHHVSTGIRSVLARQARFLRPEEAIAILQIDAGSDQSTLSTDQSQALLSLYEVKEQFKEAAAVARAIAEEASGTPSAEKAWYKTAWLEYKAADYRSSKRTLEELLPQQEVGTVERTETNRLLGLTNYQTGDYEEARTHFDAALESGLLDKGKREELALLYAYSHLYRQEYSDARAQLQSLLAENPSRIIQRRVTRLVQQLGSRN